MDVLVEKQEKGMAKLTITIPAEKVSEAIEKAYQKNKGKISIPGFRKGKVPRPMIEKMYGKEVFYEDAADFLVYDSYDEAVGSCGEEVVSSPKLNVEQIEEGKPFIFTAIVALKPEITLGKYKGVKVPQPDVEVSEEEITTVIEKEREKNARIILVTDRAVKDGDMVVLDFEGFIDGEAFEGGKGEDYSLTIGSGAFIPGFEEKLVGAEIDKEIEVKVTFPEDYHASELAGKDATFVCTVKEIKEQELPELDDEFASEISEFDTMEEYRQDVEAKLKEEKSKNAKDERTDAVIDAIIADADIEIPEPMLETQKRKMMDEFADNIKRQGGVSMEQYMQITGMDAKALMEMVAPQAKSRIESTLVLEAIVEAEGITATDAELEEELKDAAEKYQLEYDRLSELMGEEGKEKLRKDITMRKAIDLVVDSAVDCDPDDKKDKKEKKDKKAKKDKKDE